MAYVVESLILTITKILESFEHFHTTHIEVEYFHDVMRIGRSILLNVQLLLQRYPSHITTLGDVLRVSNSDVTAGHKAFKRLTDRSVLGRFKRVVFSKTYFQKLGAVSDVMQTTLTTLTTAVKVTEAEVKEEDTVRKDLEAETKKPDPPQVVESNDKDSSSQLNMIEKVRDDYGMTHNCEMSVEWYCQAADKGDAAAQYTLGYMYCKGQNVTQNFVIAADLLQLAADQGYEAAQYELGSLYENGHGVTQSSATAVEWYRRAAEQDYAVAQFHLGNMYRSGHGVAQNHTTAVEWYRRAADQDYAAAQFNLGFMYDNGRGVTQSYKMASDWYNRAAKQGYTGV
jgi:TPR repeat protein